MRHLPVLVLLLAGCGDGGSGGGGKAAGSYDEAADEAVNAMQEFGQILDKVTDKASADAAKPKLEALAKRFDGIVQAVGKLGPPSAEQEKRTDAKMTLGLQALSPKTMAYIERVFASPEVGKTLEQPFAAVQKRILELRGVLGG